MMSFRLKINGEWCEDWEPIQAHIMDMEKKIEKQDAEIERLKNALQALYDIQDGTPLVAYTDEWNEAMDEAEKCLTEKAGE